MTQTIPQSTSQEGVYKCKVLANQVIYPQLEDCTIVNALYYRTVLIH